MRGKEVVFRACESGVSKTKNKFLAQAKDEKIARKK